MAKTVFYGEPFKPTLMQRVRLAVQHPLLVTTQATLPAFALYGGATISRIPDGAGRVWRAFCARKLSDNVFGFRLTVDGQEVPYSPFCTGRGSINGSGW